MSADAEAVGNDDNVRQREQHPLFRHVKAVNLMAIQTVTGLIDALDYLITRCNPPPTLSTPRGASATDWQGASWN